MSTSLLTRWDAFKAAHACTEACTGTGTIGGVPTPLTCPYARLRPVQSEADRKIVARILNYKTEG